VKLYSVLDGTQDWLVRSVTWKLPQKDGERYIPAGLPLARQAILGRDGYHLLEIGVLLNRLGPEIYLAAGDDQLIVSGTHVCRTARLLRPLNWSADVAGSFAKMAVRHGKMTFAQLPKSAYTPSEAVEHWARLRRQADRIPSSRADWTELCNTLRETQKMSGGGGYKLRGAETDWQEETLQSLLFQ